MNLDALAYVLDDSDSEAVRRRHESIARIWDEGTFALLDRLGIAAGWLCLELGAGGGTVARWLAHRVGARGHVVATDRDTALLDRASAANLEVRRLDIVADEMPEPAFDLVYTRLLIEHVGLDSISRIATALRPGGVLFVEELSFLHLLDKRCGPDGGVLELMEEI